MSRKLDEDGDTSKEITNSLVEMTNILKGEDKKNANETEKIPVCLIKEEVRDIVGTEGDGEVTAVHIGTEKDNKETIQNYQKKETMVLVILTFIAAFLSFPVIMGIGAYRGWNITELNRLDLRAKPNPYRFWPEPNAYEVNKFMDGLFKQRSFDAAGTTWYYWKLRPVMYVNGREVCDESIMNTYDGRNITSEMMLLSCKVKKASKNAAATVWIFYLIHQFCMWTLIYFAQKSSKHGRKAYSFSLKWFNKAGFIVNGVAFVAHLVQTHISYDGLAQNTSEASARASILLLFTYIIIIEYKNRGLFFGMPSVAYQQQTTASASDMIVWWNRSVDLMRKYHGYIFSWATIFNFWYHPMENSFGHAFGFFHSVLLMMQSSLMFNRAHRNRYWRFFLETFTGVQLGIASLQVSSGRKEEKYSEWFSEWSMYVFGFLLLFSLTQINGIPFYLKRSTRSPTKVSILIRAMPFCSVAIIVVIAYTTILRPIRNIVEVLVIPMATYICFFVTASGAAYMHNVYKLHHGLSGGDEDSQLKAKSKISVTMAILGCLICFGIVISFTILAEKYILPIRIIYSTFAFLAIFDILSLVVMISLNEALGRSRPSNGIIPHDVEIAEGRTIKKSASRRNHSVLTDKNMSQKKSDFNDNCKNKRDYNSPYEKQRRMVSFSEIDEVNEDGKTTPVMSSHQKNRKVPERNVYRHTSFKNYNDDVKREQSANKKTNGKQRKFDSQFRTQERKFVLGSVKEQEQKNDSSKVIVPNNDNDCENKNEETTLSRSVMDTVPLRNSYVASRENLRCSLVKREEQRRKLISEASARRRRASEESADIA